MLISMFGIAMITSGPKVPDTPLLGFRDLCLYQKNHVKIFRWILLWGYKNVKGLMQYG